MPTPGDDTAVRRRALVIATQRYGDATLSQLHAPGRDASDFAAVLADGVGRDLRYVLRSQNSTLSAF